MNADRILAVADKEVRYLLRDRRSLGVTLLLPVALLILYGYAINFDVREIPLAVYDPDRSAESRDLVQTVTRTGYFRLVRTLESPTQAEDVLQRGEAKVVLVLPAGFAADLAAGRTASLQTVVDGADSLTATISLSYLEAMTQEWALRRLAAAGGGERRAPPISPEVRVWYNEGLASTHFIIPGLVVLILMMVAALLTSQTIVREREQGTIEGLVVLPVTPRELIAGKLLPYVAIAAVDVALIGVAGKLLFGVPLRGSPALLSGLMLIYIIAALGTGLLISVLTRSQQLAYMIALIATLLPTMLLTGFVFPVASMPKVLQVVVQLHPSTHFMVIVRGLALKGAGIGVLWPRALALTVIAGALLAASAAKFKKTL